MKIIWKLSKQLIIYMFEIKEEPVLCINDKCIYPSNNHIRHKNYTLENENDLYGSSHHYEQRFGDLGVPLFLLKIEDENSDDNNKEDKDIVIPENLFYFLLERVEKKSPKKKHF